MSYSQFVLHLKSTLDKLIYDITTEGACEYFDLDSCVLPEAIINSKEPGIGWSLSHVTPDPIDPMYSLEFEIAVRTTDDPAQYTSMNLMSLVLERVCRHMSVSVRDYTGTSQPTTNGGSLLVVDVNVMPQQFDRATGFRFVNVRAKATRW